MSINKELINIIQEQKNKEDVKQKECVVIYSNIDMNNSGMYMYVIFHTIMTFISVYLAYRCNNGFEWGTFIVSLFFPYIYIIYTLSSRGTCGVFERPNISVPK
jgi:uncharacterized membrane protein (DUF485 family)